MDLIWIMLGFFVFITIVFVILGLFYPEWLGITGQRAREIQAHQQDESSEKKD